MEAVILHQNIATQSWLTSKRFRAQVVLGVRRLIIGHANETPKKLELLPKVAWVFPSQI